MKIALDDLVDNVYYHTHTGGMEMYATGGFLKKIYKHPRIVEVCGDVDSIEVKEYAKEKEE
jgi:hypothetical protein